MPGTCRIGKIPACLVMALGLLAATSTLAAQATAASAEGALVLAPNHGPTSGPSGKGHHGPGPGPGGGSVWPGWQSSNWSGYAETSAAPYTSVTGNWEVPSVSPSKSATYSAAWTGIDGFSNSSLIQTGTEQDYSSGSASYFAWWTTSSLGFLEQQITSGCSSGGADCGLVSPGDPMSAVIQETSAATSTWSITLSDKASSHPWSFSTSVSYSGPGASAEWIIEAPSVNGRIATLAHYSPTVFDPDNININTTTTSPDLLDADAGEMLSTHGRPMVISIPSFPDSDSDGFAINYGSNQPPAPSS